MKLNARNSQLATLSFLAFLVLAAVLIRAPELGKWCLTVDEFYYSEPVSSILEKGLPVLKGGGDYFRGFGLTYLTALSTLIFKNWEFAVRLPILIFGVMTIPLFFLICRAFLPFLPSLLCTAVLLLSSWHIEFSRFARFYAPFQFVFLCFIYFFYFGYWQHIRYHKILAWIIAILSITIYEGSVFIPFIFLLLFLKEERPLDRRNAKILAGIIILMVLNMGVQKGIVTKFLHFIINSETQLVGQNIPSALASLNKTNGYTLPIVLPRPDLFLAVWKTTVSIIGYMILLLWSNFLIIKESVGKKDFWTITSIIIASILPIFHQYGIMVLLLTLIFIERKVIILVFVRNWKIWIPYFGLSLIFWIAVMYSFGFITENKNQSLHFFVGYPPVKYSILIPFLNNVPIWAIIVVCPIILSIVHNLVKKEADSGGIILKVVLILIFLMASIETTWKETRYIFFFFPLLLLVGQLEFYQIGKWLESALKGNAGRLIMYCFIFIPFTAFLFTEDFNPYHIVNVSSAEANFRMGRYEKLSTHWYPRVDFESPARYVNRAFKDGDIIVLDHAAMSKYVDKPYVNYVTSQDHIRFPYHARKFGTIEKWTARPLISSKGALAILVPKEGKGSLWLIAATIGGYVGTSFSRKNHSPDDIAEEYNLSVKLRYKGIDGRIGVWQFKCSPFEKYGS